MPHLSYDENSMPTPEQFRRDLREIREKYDPLDDLLYLQRKLLLLEQKYGLSSEECYRRFHEGTMGDDPDIFGWVFYYEGFRDLKAAISEVLETVAAEPQPVR